MNTKRKTYRFLFLLLFSFIFLGSNSTLFAESKHGAREIALSSQLPEKHFSDLIIESHIKKNMEWRSKTYSFTFKLEGEKYVKEVKGKVENGSDIKDETGHGVHFSTKVRFRLPAGKHTILFDSPEKFRPLVVSVETIAGKVNKLQFKPVYSYSEKEKKFRDTLSEFEAIFNGKKIPIRYERFNVH